jgi:uncharacterized membrane protein
MISHSLYTVALFKRELFMQARKSISFEYTLSNDIITEAIKATAHYQFRSTRLLIIFCALYGFNCLLKSNIEGGVLWLLIAVSLIFVEIFFSTKFVSKRMQRKYTQKFGSTNVKILAELGPTRLHYRVNGHVLNFIYGGIRHVEESDNLIVVVTNSEMAILDKRGIKGGTPEDALLFINDKMEEAEKSRKKRRFRLRAKNK